MATGGEGCERRRQVVVVERNGALSQPGFGLGNSSWMIQEVLGLTLGEAGMAF